MIVRTNGKNFRRRKNERSQKETYTALLWKCIRERKYLIKKTVTLHVTRGAEKSLEIVPVDWLERPSLRHNRPHKFWDTCKQNCILVSHYWISIRKRTFFLTYRDPNTFQLLVKHCFIFIALCFLHFRARFQNRLKVRKVLALTIIVIKQRASTKG